MPATRRERKKQAQRERIVAAAAELIRSQGLAPTTVEQIAERADISQTTFFNYFRSKSQLIDALLGDVVARFDTLMRDPEVAGDGSVTARIGALFEVSADLTEVQQRMLRDLIGAVIRAPNASTDSRIEALRTSLVADLAAGQARGEVRDDCEPDELAETVLGLYVGVFLFWAAAPGPDHPVPGRLRTTGRLAVELVRHPKADR